MSKSNPDMEALKDAKNGVKWFLEECAERFSKISRRSYLKRLIKENVENELEITIIPEDIHVVISKLLYQDFKSFKVLRMSETSWKIKVKF